MVDEQEPPRRVVKRVVKKTVVRPAEPTPKLRYGRPVATTTAPPAKVRTRRGRSADKAAQPAAARQRADVRGTVATVGRRTGQVSRVVARGVGRGARTGGGVVAARARAVAAWRLPHINVHLAAAITGAVVGLVTVGLGVLALAIFEAIRGVSSGGGLWGGLTVVGIAVVAALLGESLLRGFGAHSARLTSGFAVVLAIVALLGLFLDLADSWTAIIIVPVLGVVAFSLSYWLIDLAENTPPVID